MKRRHFIRDSFVLGTSAPWLTKPFSAAISQTPWNKHNVQLRFGVCADLHHDLIKDGVERIEAFTQSMNIEQPDFVIQMGDFCTPKPENKLLMHAWEKFLGPKYHVIGNHDVDGGFTHQDIIKFWNISGAYYSFDLNGYHFVILNGNERRSQDVSRYPRSILKEQYDWLSQDLDGTSFPIIVFCHQGIDNDLDGLMEGNIIRLLFERTNKKARYRKIQLVLSGHHHEDYLNWYNDIPYLQINSIAYQFARTDRGYRFAHTVEPIWAFITILNNGMIIVKGRESTYIDNLSSEEQSYYRGYATVPHISDRVIPYPGQLPYY
ncbi:metallophosphoesterase [Olivibacter sp. CPCC 100613]|uniref:metallophosphoesterase family protein n=1 Tax=Olivibacter sp. CPCC 100613 TaxID=3079931 RepID=UPI002FF53EAF